MDGPDPAALLAGLNDAQARAVTTEAEPLCIHAGAGSGKTRVLTRRIAHRIATDRAEARHVLALTFTRKAAGELRSRLRRLDLRDEVAAGTFHGIAYAQLRARWADQGREAPRLLDRKARFLVPLLPRSGPRVSAVEVASEIEWASARVLDAATYPREARAHDRRTPLPVEEIARLIDAYAARKREQRVVDFDDLLRLCIRGLETDAEFAAAQRWRFRHLFVDEFQDVNPLQFRLLRGWLGDRTDLCVVGDPNQAVYGWNGADARYLDRFEEHVGPGEVVRLTDNYRSSPQILATADAVLADGPGEPRPLVAHAPDGPAPTITRHADDRVEADAVARAARDRHHPGAAWSRQAVLVRTNGQAALLSEAFTAARIPHRLRGTSGLLDRPEVQDALRLLGDGDAETAVADLDALAQGQADPSEFEPPTAAVARPAESTLPATAADDRGRRGLDEEARTNLAALVRLAREYLALEPGSTGAATAGWIRSTLRSGDGDAGRDAVDIVTFHAAKGLEWEMVHVAGMEDGLVPIGHARTPAARAEERRLVYVALTRAERELHCSWAERRTFGGSVSDRTPSPYLTSIARVVESLPDDGAGSDWRRHLDDNRRRLAHTDPGRSERVDDAAADDVARRVTALRRWRLDAARAADVAPAAVLDDRLLASVAARRPSTVDELAAIEGMGPMKADRFGADLLAALEVTPADH